MMGILIVQIAATVEAAIKREEWIRTLPQDQQAIIRRQNREELEHRRQQEIAEAARPRNFWGD